jgi:hypothetical protein
MGGREEEERERERLRLRLSFTRTRFISLFEGFPQLSFKIAFKPY